MDSLAYVLTAGWASGVNAYAVVLVTGVSRWLGGALAAELATDPSIDRVIGVDTVPPAPEVLRRLGRTEFVRADIRSPLIGKVIDSAAVDTVVHMNISRTPASANDPAAKFINFGQQNLTVQGESPYINSGHPTGTNFVFCDGHVSFLSDTIDGTVYAKLITPAGSRLPGSIRQSSVRAQVADD